MDRINFFRGVLGSMKLLWPQLMKIDLFKMVPEIKIPVFFMEGRFDYECLSDIAAKYFEILKALSKELIWFEKPAHFINSQERDLFTEILVEKILRIAVSQDAS
jgi:pimeloyl-ACP methyl ester carboxylesterase